MVGKRTLVVGGLLAALGVPAGVAVAATDAPSPRPAAPGEPGDPGYGPRMGGHGNPADCPIGNSPEAQQWRDQRADRQQLPPAERQRLAQQHREQMHKLMATSP